MATKGIERLVRDKGSETKLLSGVAHCLAAVGLVLGGSAVTSPSSKAVATGRSTAQITVLYDAFGNTSSMQKDWGYAALVEYGGRRILFDTGNKPDILALNAKAKGIDLSKLDFVVMSHRHGDHMGGMAYLLSVNPKVKIRAFRPPVGVAYGRIEAPKGELGFYLVSDGGPNPYRYRVRPPSFINLTVLEDLCLGHTVADVMVILGSVDIVMGEVDR